jgi:hypothetical protein
MAKHKDAFGFAMYGAWHWQVAEVMRQAGVRTMRIDPTLIAEYFGIIRELKPRLVVAPLWDCPFNHSKSNIAWIEAVYSGALCLAPAWPEWERPGCLNYRNAAEFSAAMDAVMSMPDAEVEDLNLKAWRWIQNNVVLSRVNNRREKLVYKLAAKR